MNRLIKFRGRDAYGKFHFGDVWQRTDGTVLFDHDQHVWQRVHPDSVAQFVGYDCDGKEVYEGDVIIDKYGRGETVAHYRDNPEFIAIHKLKEDDQ